MDIFPSREWMTELTSSWHGERFEDGRPKVPDAVLSELRTVTTEQIWQEVWDEGYLHAFAGGWKETRPGHIVVGRAVTAQFMPSRPDLNVVIMAAAAREQVAIRADNQNWLVVESLREDDVMVVDIFGKVYEGTVIGDNLGTVVSTRTRAGAVIHGGIRDLDGISRLQNINVFYRGTDPTPIRNVSLTGVNIPIRIDNSTVLPGDVIHGSSSGILAIPPHLAVKICERALNTRDRDEFGKSRLAAGSYTASQIDNVWTPEIERDFREWRGSRAR